MQPKANYLPIFLWLILYLPYSSMASNTALSETVSNGEKIVRSNWPAAYMGTNSNMDLIDLTLLEPCPPDMTFEDCRHWMTDQLPPKTPRNLGEGGICIKRDNNGFIEIGLSFQVQAAAYAQYHPDIYLRYTVGGETGTMSESSMYQSGYTFSKTIRINLSSLEPDQLFQYTFELLTKDANNQYIPYPVDAYPNLFVEYTESIRPIPISGDKTVLTGWKSLCGLLIWPSSPLQSDNSNRAIFQQNKLKSTTTSSTSTTQMIDEINLKATPNPFTNQLILEGNITENSIVQLFDIQGKLIYHKELTNFAVDSPKMIDTSLLPTSMYYCQIKNRHSSQTIKVVKR